MTKVSAEGQGSFDLAVFYGVKAGMTRVFDESGNHVAVTVIKIVPNHVSQVKTSETDGYNAYQIAYGEKRLKLITKPVKGHLEKAKVPTNATKFSEIKATNADTAAIGKQVTLGLFEVNTYVDVTGVSKGKGFQGVIKRWNFRGGPAAHGSHFHRRPGSIGNRATPARVFRGKKLPGCMGDKQKTIQNLKVHELNLEKGFILIRGSVPGSKNSFLKISRAIKK